MTNPVDPAGLKVVIPQHAHGLADIPVGRGPRKVVGTDDLSSTSPGAPGAAMVGFDNAGSGLTADTVQGALDELVTSGAGFRVETSQWSSVLTGITPDFQTFDQSLVVPAGTVTAGRTLEIYSAVVATASSDCAFDLRVNGVSLFPGGIPLKFTAGIWPQTWTARITNAGAAAGAPFGATDTLINNLLGLKTQTGVDPIFTTLNISNDALGAPAFDPLAQLTITVHWQYIIADGNAYLRHLSARLL